MTKLKKYVNTYNKIMFVLTLLLALTSIICSAVISYNTSFIESHALTIEYNHEHAEHTHEQVQITAYNVVPNLGNTQMVTVTGEAESNQPSQQIRPDGGGGSGSSGTPSSKVGEPPCPTCGCPVKGCSKCYKATTTTGSDGKTTTTYTLICKSNKTDKPCPMNITKQTWYKEMMQITDIIDQILTPVLIILGTAGSIFVIVLGINFSKAESADKREEAKKRMINAIIGIVVTLLFLILVKLFTANAEAVVQFVNGVA